MQNINKIILESYYNVINESKFEVHDAGLGLVQLSSDEVILYGGMRDGSSPAGTTRLKYFIYVPSLAGEDGDWDKAKVGEVSLYVGDSDPLDFKALINLEFSKEHQGKGYGKYVINNILDSMKDSELPIHDIQKSARGFWDKMGIEYKGRLKTSGVIRK